ncbi:unnamed protein product [Clonostachys rosea f. rosea IK726]|uniref:Uncharacterized protein n=2 Tax=Bionectria ochroleuca TaxID=29856 RepID=A0A0B7K0Y7_BIOOC|nr:unnamed protein product [Clonostachys rosea f. rosea IK726]
MAKKARQRISYVLESAKSSAGGHRLGVNGLAVDRDNNILFSGGRDGIVCAWDLNLDLNNPPSKSTDNADANKEKTSSKLRAQTQAHMGWINDIAWAQNGSALVTASSDLTVKVWRPHSAETTEAQPIGAHADYVMRLATPPADMNANWVASGGLDRKICLWDLNGKGQTLEIDVQGEEIPAKGSVYSLSVGRNIIACGGPEKTVRLYDPRSGEKVSKLVGHLDNIRAILIDDAGDTILSASSDKTIKLWSVKNGRCIYTYTMHEDSVWSLYSDDPRLGVFYSADRSGLVAKTDVRGSWDDMDDGLSLAVIQEHSSVFKVVAAGGHIWTGTEHSSIHRWADVDTSDKTQFSDAFKRDRATSAASKRPRESSISSAAEPSPKTETAPSQSILRISNTASFPMRPAVGVDSNANGENITRKMSEIVIEQPDFEPKPIHSVPTETIEGQFGLLKHKLLNDRRRVLTLDTAGEVMMWDLIKCVPIQSFGKQPLEDVERVVNTREAVAPWCSVDSSSGNLSVVLEPYNCFDAEVYADELQLEEPVEFREDQRISLGKWILRYLFANLIDAEIKQDEEYRRALDEGNETKRIATRANAPTSIEIPRPNLQLDTSDKVSTPRATGAHLVPTTPGLAIGLATPAPLTSLPNVPEGVVSTPLSPLEKRQSHASRQSTDNDYFTSTIGPADGGAKPAVTTPAATPAAETPDPKTPAEGPKGKDKAVENGKSTPFGKFRMFGSKKLNRSASQTAPEKPAIVDEKAEESESSSNHEKEVDDSFYGVIQKIRNDYDRQATEQPDKPVETGVTPSLPADTPVLKLPPNTKVIIQEETSGGSANIYQGTVETVGNDAETIEQKAPMWLGHLLLQNQVPYKDPVKVSFVLHPLGDLPAIATADGNNRLNANRMLRVKKILAYVAERIEKLPEEPEPDALKPEEYLELYCNDQVLDPLMSLATLRTHVWKGGNDIVLHYKSNGRKEIQIAPPQPEEPAEGTEAAAQDAPTGSENDDTTPNQPAA